MELFTVTLPSRAEESAASALRRLLAQHAENLHKDAGIAIVRYQWMDDKHVSCIAEMPDFRLNEHGSSVYRSAARALSEFVVMELEPDILSDMIRRKYRNHDESDAAVIEKYCHDLLYGTEWEGLGAKFHDADRQRRKGKVAEEIEGYLQEHTTLNLDGFVAFRLQPYRTELAEIVEYALDEYVLDKQYQEFISLLKYFVCLQETKIPAVHLLHKGGHEFEMYNDRLQPLEPKPHTDRLVAEMLETEINIEDMVISSLIAISPRHITIHTRQPEAQVIRTIETIFDNRVTICKRGGSCGLCVEEMDSVKP